MPHIGTGWVKPVILLELTDITPENLRDSNKAVIITPASLKLYTVEDFKE